MNTRYSNCRTTAAFIYKLPTILLPGYPQTARGVWRSVWRIMTSKLDYGLPKIHKLNWPLCPILIQIDSPTHKTPRYTTNLLMPFTGKLTHFTTVRRYNTAVRRTLWWVLRNFFVNEWSYSGRIWGADRVYFDKWLFQCVEVITTNKRRGTCSSIPITKITLHGYWHIWMTNSWMRSFSFVLIKSSYLQAIISFRKILFAAEYTVGYRNQSIFHLQQRTESWF